MGFQFSNLASYSNLLVCHAGWLKIGSVLCDNHITLNLTKLTSANATTSKRSVNDKFTCRTTSTSYELPLLFWYPRNREPLYSSDVATPGWWVLIGAGGTREAGDGQAEPVVRQHSARTGIMSAKVSPSATVMNFGNTPQLEKEGVLTQEGRPAAPNARGPKLPWITAICPWASSASY